MIEIPIWLFALSCSTVLTAAVLAATFAYRVGLAKGQAESAGLYHDSLRELQFRDEMEAEAHKSRTVTRSGNANPGRSRVRKAIRGR